MELRLLGLRIKELRKKKKMTQEELSESAGMNSKHLSEVERGIINISIQNLDKIADSLGVPLVSLLEAEHQLSQGELRQEIDRALDDASEEDLRLIHRLVHDVLL